MQELLDWTIGLAVGPAIALSIAINTVMFALALAFGEVVVRVWKKRPVAMTAPPVTRSEVLLATACVVVNSGVMLAGWALFRARWLHVDGETRVWRWAVDALLLVVAMDIAMYVTHRLAHHPIAFRWVHGVHHRYDAPRPLTLFVLHPLEVAGFGGLWILVLCAHAFSLGGMLAYLTINLLFGVLGHVGVEPLPRAWVRWPIVHNIGTSTFHARHHQTPTSSFGFYTTVWDRLFRTLDPSYRIDFAELPRARRHPDV